MKNDSNPIIRSEEVTIDMHICAALSESRSSGEIYFAAIAPDMELTVITLDEAPDILPCFDEDDAYLNIPDSSLLLSYNPAQVLKLAGKHYLTGPVILVRTNMLIVQDQVWGRVTANRSVGKSTRYYADEFHLLLKDEQTAAYSVEIWKRFRKWGGIPTALTQNVKDLLASPEVSNIFENSDFVYMLNQANGDRQILAKQLNISPHQLSYVTHSGEGEGLLFFGNVILPFVDHFPKDLELYRILTTKLNEISEGAQK